MSPSRYLLRDTKQYGRWNRLRPLPQDDDDDDDDDDRYWMLHPKATLRSLIVPSIKGALSRTRMRQVFESRFENFSLNFSSLVRCRQTLWRPLSHAEFKTLEAQIVFQSPQEGKAVQSKYQYSICNEAKLFFGVNSWCNRSVSRFTIII